MKRNILIPSTAAFLLTIISLNMIIGFAYANVILMGFNSSRYEAIEVKAAKGYDHSGEVNKDDKSKHGKNKYCIHHIVEFFKIAKSLPRCYGGLNRIFFPILISSFYRADVLHISKLPVNTRYLARSHYLPIPDTRITIQSFQI